MSLIMEQLGYLLSRNHLQLTSQKVEYLNLYNEYLKLSKLPIEFYIPLTDACNLACSYCFQKKLKFIRNLNMKELVEILAAISTIVRRHNDEKFSIVILGGEPLLPQNYLLVEKILAYSNVSKIPVRIITNGTNIHFYESLFQTYKDCISSLVVTVDGNERTHNKKRKYKDGRGSYNTIMEGLAILEKLGVKYVIRVNLTKALLNDCNLNSVKQISRNIIYHRVQYEEDYSKNCSYREIYKWVKNGAISTNQMALNSINYFEYLMDDSYLNYPIFNYCNTNQIFYFSLDHKNIYCCNEKEYEFLKISDLDSIADIKIRGSTRLIYDKICEQCTTLPLCGGGCKLTKKGNHYTTCPYYIDILEMIDYHLSNEIVKENL